MPLKILISQFFKFTLHLKTRLTCGKIRYFHYYNLCLENNQLAFLSQNRLINKV